MFVFGAPVGHYVRAMRSILVTGSSGYLGQALIPALRARGQRVVGLDPVPGPSTDVVGTVADRATITRVMDEHDVGSVIHAGALHKPQVATHSRQAFVDVNVSGTLNLLEETVAHGADRFVLTSTTSVTITGAHRRGNIERAQWIAEDFGPLAPRNVYGVTKLAAEHVARMFHEIHGLPVVVLRTSRFFPEEDDAAHTYPQAQDNAKLNELLFRRLALEDVVSGHVLAWERAPELGYELFLLSALTPFVPEDCAQLLEDAPRVVRRYFPGYEEVFRPRGWTMFDRIDRVYDARRAAKVLGWKPRVSFSSELLALGG
jgi:UDP-glucose 4-epimerase